MREIKPVKMYLISAVMFFSMVFVLCMSIRGYVNYFLKSDIISFSFPLGIVIFGSPLLSWFLYWMVVYGYKKGNVKSNKKLNKKITNSLTAIAIFGIVFSFFFSFYVEYDLTSRGYVKCHKKSIHAPTKYIISKNMCE
ncbi:DUF1240 domain-containing protein [Morganella morganii]|uniref:DUF1240 domain-containing protein n=1 Tax=Morganella morganii TaxID=582 RepID=UPI002368C800|nr:DUF1240 domain-containing protein [Morganella morganii]